MSNKLNTIGTENKMLIVNLFGAPGAGKSTAAAYIFARLKMAGVKCELATEFAKDAVWENNQEALRNQIKILGEQYFRITRCEGKVDVLITDSPIFNSYYYNSDPTLGDEFKQLILNLVSKYENMNFFINRTKPYVQEGRLQNEKESDAVAVSLKKLMTTSNLSFSEFNGDIEDYDKIVQIILAVVRDRGLIKQEIAALDPFSNKDNNASVTPVIQEDTKSTTKNTNLKKVHIYTDGSCHGNPGPGGFGVIVIRDGVKTELVGGESQTTNNRMEILAAITGLENLDEPSNVIITTDSQYLCKAIMDDWIQNWKNNGWKTTAKKPVLNQDLWERLDILLRKHNVLCQWIKGHNGNPYNERCDKLAKTAMQRYK